MAGRASGDGDQPSVATRVVLSYDETDVDEALRFWVGGELSGERTAARLRDDHAEARAGEEWPATVSRGCGVPVDVPLRVERVAGGRRVSPETEIRVESR